MGRPKVINVDDLTPSAEQEAMDRAEKERETREAKRLRGNQLELALVEMLALKKLGGAKKGGPR